MLGTGLLVPLLYGVVSVMAVQSASFAATSAARESARGLRHRLDRRRRVRHGPGRRPGSCSPTPGCPWSCPRSGAPAACLAPGSRVDVTVTVDVPLPLLPGGPTVTVTGVESMPVDTLPGGP